MSVRWREAAPSQRRGPASGEKQARWPENKVSMTNAWFNAFTISTTPADPRQGIHGNSRQYRRVALGRTLWGVFLFATILFMQGSIALAQELDSSTLQKEAEQE